jgi:hypothetical protein
MLSFANDLYLEPYFRIGDRVLLVDTAGSSFDFSGAGLVVGQAKGTIIELPSYPSTMQSVLDYFDDIALAITVLKTRILLENPLERLAREV